MTEITKEKIITIKDLGNELKFKIKLFGAIEGLDFMDKALSVINSSDKLSIKPFLDDLLRLCIPLDTSGIKPLSPSFSLAQAGALVQNPLSIIELGMEILEFQQVFTQDSELFQSLTNNVRNIFSTKISGSVH